MDDDKLIILVEDNDLLYNKFSKDYKIPNKKLAAWAQIGKRMEIPAELCMKRWTSLRDRYVKERKNENTPSGSGSTYRHRFYLMDQMGFLAPHITPRAVRSTINILEEFVSKDTPVVVQRSTQEFLTLESATKESQYLESTFFESPSQESSFLSSTSLEAGGYKIHETVKQKNKKKRSEEVKNSMILIKYLQKQLTVLKNFANRRKEKKNDEKIMVFMPLAK